MTARNIKNPSASVHQRLLNKAKETERPFNELLQYYAMERFLYRLSQTKGGERFVLKGALMLMVWNADALRPTMDIDLLGRIENDIEGICAIMRSACGQKVDADGMAFDADSVSGARIAEDAEYEGVRVLAKGNLGNARVSIQIDIGFGDVISPSPRVIKYPTILDYPAPHMRGYSRESTVAEKFHAMIRHDFLNSRMKDFYDIWLLSRQFGFDGESLASAIRKTFERRQTELSQAPVVGLSEKFYRDPAKATLWKTFIRKSRLSHAPQSMEAVALHVSKFILPVYEALARHREWSGQWKPGGPWEMTD